jgi:hypothetical protein
MVAPSASRTISACLGELLAVGHPAPIGGPRPGQVLRDALREVVGAGVLVDCGGCCSVGSSGRSRGGLLVTRRFVSARSRIRFCRSFSGCRAAFAEAPPRGNGKSRSPAPPGTGADGPETRRKAEPRGRAARERQAQGGAGLVRDRADRGVRQCSTCPGHACRLAGWGSGRVGFTMASRRYRGVGRGRAPLGIASCREESLRQARGARRPGR